jgi:hypothetical protein
MSRELRALVGVLLVVIPTVMYGAVTLLSLLIRRATGYVDNPLRHDLWRPARARGCESAYVGGVFLAVAVLTLGVGLIRGARKTDSPDT